MIQHLCENGFTHFTYICIWHEYHHTKHKILSHRKPLLYTYNDDHNKGNFLIKISGVSQKF